MAARNDFFIFGTSASITRPSLHLKRESLAAPSKPKEWRACPLYIICMRHLEHCSMHLLDHGFKAPGALRRDCECDAKLVAQDPAGCLDVWEEQPGSFFVNLRIFLHCSPTSKVTWNHLCLLSISVSLVSAWCLLEIFNNTTKSKLINFACVKAHLGYYAYLVNGVGLSHGDSIMIVRPMRKTFFSNVSSLCWLLWENKSIHKRANESSVNFISREPLRMRRSFISTHGWWRMLPCQHYSAAVDDFFAVLLK